MTQEVIREILERIGYKIHRDFGSYWTMRPLYRESDNDGALLVDKESGRFHDFVTKEYGDFLNLVSLTVGEKQAKEIVGPNAVHNSNIQEEKRHEPDMPIIFDPSELKDLLPSYNFYIKKGISVETLKLFKCGMRTYGKLNDRLVFPIFNRKKKLVGLTGRDLTGRRQDMKWKHLGSRNNWDYPYFLTKDEIAAKKSVILVESIGDMLALYDAGIKNVLVLFGVSLGTELLKTLVIAAPQRIIISTNNDFIKDVNVGAKAAEGVKNKLSKQFSVNNIDICLPSKKDFGEMTKAEILEWAKKNKI